MSRFVTPQRKVLVSKSASTANEKEDLKSRIVPYFERVAKYVPSEILVGYMTINAIPLTDLPVSIRFWLLLIIFVLFAIVTPAYFRLIAQPGDPVRTQQVVSFIAFVIWAYAIGGNQGVFGVDGFDLYYKSLASMQLIVFSVVSSLIIPEPPPIRSTNT